MRSPAADLNYELRLLVGTDLLAARCCRVITSRIEDQLSDHLQRGRTAHGDTVMLEVSPRGRLRVPRQAAPERNSLARFPTSTGRAGLGWPPPVMLGSGGPTGHFDPAHPTGTYLAGIL